MENNCTYYKVEDEITYPFSNFSGVAVEVCEWISNFTPHFTRHIFIHHTVKVPQEEYG